MIYIAFLKLLFFIFCSHKLQAVSLSHCPPSIVSSSSSSPSSPSTPSSLFIQVPFWWTRAPMDVLPLLALDLNHHTLGSAGSLLSSVSRSPYICTSVNLKKKNLKTWCLFILMFSFLLLIFSWGLSSSRSPWWTGGCVAQPAQSSAWIYKPNFTYIGISNRYSVNAICQLWFCCSFLIMRCLLHTGRGILLCGSS